MAVKFTKPEINVREKLAELDKPSGIAGEALLRADSVQEQRDLIGAGRRNAIINGGFDVWQRGTSVTTNGFDEYTVDRFMGYGKTSSWGGSYVATTFSRQAFAAGQTEVPGNPKYYARLTGTSTGRKNTFSTYLEDATTFSGQIVTLSFYARSSTPVFLDTQVQQSFGSVNTVDFDPNITTTDTWTRYVRVFKMPSLAGETISSDSKLIVYLLRTEDVPSGTTLDFANAQLELGSVATEFDNSLSYGEQLALCSRYYQRQDAAGGDGHLTVYVDWDALSAYGRYNYPMGVMRALPTVSLSSVDHFKAYQAGEHGACTSFATEQVTLSSVELRMQASGVVDTAGQCGWIRFNNTNAYIEMDAEL